MQVSYEEWNGNDMEQPKIDLVVDRQDKER